MYYNYNYYNYHYTYVLLCFENIICSFQTRNRYNNRYSDGENDCNTHGIALEKSQLDEAASDNILIKQ